jgi:hypothetical protein
MTAAGPTKNISGLLGLRSPHRDDRTRNRTRYVHFSFVRADRAPLPRLRYSSQQSGMSAKGYSGVDTFKFAAGSAFNAVDTVQSFNTADGDKIDIADVLDGHYNSGTDVITNFVQIQTNGSNSELFVDTTGTATFGVCSAYCYDYRCYRPHRRGRTRNCRNAISGLTLDFSQGGFPAHLALTAARDHSTSS